MCCVGLFSGGLRPPPSVVSFVLALNKAHVLALNAAHVLRLKKADVLALNKARVLRLNTKICPVFKYRPPGRSIGSLTYRGLSVGRLRRLLRAFGNSWG